MCEIYCESAKKCVAINWNLNQLLTGQIDSYAHLGRGLIPSVGFRDGHVVSKVDSLIFIYRLDGMMIGLQDIHSAERSPLYVLKIRHRAI